MKDYTVFYSDENGKTGQFDAPSINSVSALTDFLSYCVENDIKPAHVTVICEVVSHG